jgi:hypothetical protein
VRSTERSEARKVATPKGARPNYKYQTIAYFFVKVLWDSLALKNQ